MTADEYGNPLGDTYRGVCPDCLFLLPTLEEGQFNRGTININGNIRHFSIAFPPGATRMNSYPIVIDFHGSYVNQRANENFVNGALEKGWPKFEHFLDRGFIVLKISSYSDKKQAADVGKFLWHEKYDNDRDDFLFVHKLIKQLLASEDIPFKIDSSSIFGTGFSSGGIFLYSYVLGGPTDQDQVELNDTYAFKAISVIGTNLRKDIVDFKGNTPETLPSVLHIQGEKDKSLWFNGVEKEKGKIDFLEFADPPHPTIKDGLRGTAYGGGWAYSAWNENENDKPSTLKKWSENLGVKYSDYETWAQYYVYNFTPTDEQILVGMRIKDCGHGVDVEAVRSIQAQFFDMIVSDSYSGSDFDSEISADTAHYFCH